MEEFKFTVHQPLRADDRDGFYQTVSILAKYPSCAYRIAYSGGDVEGHIKNAIAELKLKLIKEIVQAEFEVVND